MKTPTLVVGLLIGCVGLSASVSAQGFLAPSQSPVAPAGPVPVAPVAPPPIVAPVEPVAPVAPVEVAPKPVEQPAPTPVAPDLSPEAAATTTVAPITTTAPSPSATESSSDSGSGEPSEFMRDLFFGPVGATLGNAVYRGTFYEFDYSYASTPWIGDGAVLAGLVFHENRGAIFNSFLAVTGGAAAAASRREAVYTGSDENYDYYRGLTAEERANDDARIAHSMDNAASIAADRPLSMTAHLWHEDLGSSMNGGQIDFSWAFWIDAWSRGIVIEPGLGFAYARNHRDSGPNVPAAYAWFGASLDLRIPILSFVGIVSRGTLGIGQFALSVGLEATLGNRFVARALLQSASFEAHKDEDRITGTGLQIELGVRL